MPRPSRTPPLVLLAALTTTVPAAGQTSYPMIARVQPLAVSRGATAEVVVAGTQDFSGASAVLVEGTGLSGEVREAKKGEARLSLAVAEGAAPGPRELRLVSPQGVSTVGVVVVAADPIVAEADDKANDRPEGAQALALPCVAAGTVGKAEDVDWYAVRAEAGRTITFFIWANRLENKIHNLQAHLDPILGLHDASGRELAVDDNALFADPSLSYTFKDAGTYYLQVRDTTYAGNANWTYALHATAGPVVRSAYPLAVNPGRAATLEVAGANLPEAARASLRVPEGTPAGPALFPLDVAGALTPPVPVAVTGLPTADEADDAPDEYQEDGMPALAMPRAQNGRLSRPNDLDAFAIEAKKGQSFAFEVMARRVGSAADPVLRVLDAKNQVVAEADDTFGKDPRLEWTAPADGTFAVQVGDLHGRGGAGFAYALLAEPARPDFVASCDPDKLNAGPNSRAPLFVKIDRRGGLKAPVAFRLEGLPPGLSASPLTIPPTMSQGLIVVSAGPDAAPAGALVRLVGTAEGPDGPIVHEATPRQEIYLPGGGRGLYDVATLAAAVTAPSDITVTASPEAISLRPGGTATIDVTITRRDGFDKPVNLAVDLAHLGRVYASPLPPGVTLRASGSKTLLGPKETQGKIVLEAKPDAAPVADVPVAVLGHVSIDFVVKTAYCSAPLRLTVTPKE